MNTLMTKLGLVMDLRWMMALTFIGCFFVSAEATHISGGNMYYKCLGNDMYEITFEIRRDCEHGADDAPHRSPHIYLTIFTRDGQFCQRRGDNGYIRLNLQSIDTLNTSPDDFCIDPGEEVCVSQATYVGIACLPANPGGHILAYQKCCRNEELKNIENPLETGATWYVDITGQAMLECNSNPVFNAWPPVYICLNDDLMFDHSAVDPDADSLAYSLCTPLVGASINKPSPTKAAGPPYDSVVWVNPYGRTDMMGGTPLRIDPRTGIMTARPDDKGRYLIGVMVREYRNGQLIGYVKRDFEFNVVACGDRPTADFEVLTDKCDGLTQEFQNNSTDASSYLWLFDHPNRQPSSTDENPTHTYDSAGTYKVMLIAENDQGCRDSLFKIIEVLDPQLNPDFTIEIDCENELRLILTDQSTASGMIVSWMWTIDYPGGQLTSMDQNPSLILPNGGDITVTLKITDENGCEESITKMENVNEIVLEFFGDTIPICLGDSTKLIQNGDVNYTYTWDPQPGLKLNPPHNPTACPDTTTTYCVTVTDGFCTKEGCVVVLVQDTVPLSIMGNDSTCNGMVMLMAVAADTTLEIRWFDNPNLQDVIATGSKLTTTISTTTTFYAVVNQDGECPSVVSWTVTYFEAVDEDIDRNPIICFGGGMVELNPNGNPDYIYEWSPGIYLDDSTSFNPKAMVDTTTVFTVIITNPEFPDCPKEVVVTVSVGVDFEFEISPIDTIYCSFDTTKVSIITEPAGLDVRWCNENGDEIGSGDTICIVPNELDSLIAKVTDDLGCTKRRSIAITAYDIDVEIVVMPDSICAGDTAMIMLTNNNTDTLTVVWSPVDDIIGTNEGYVIKVNPNNTTTYTATITDGSGCEWERSVTVNVGGFPNGIEATADPRVINPGESTQLDVIVTGNVVSYMWMGEGLDFTDIKDPTATPPGIDRYVYKVKVTDDQGCMAMDTVVVTVRTPDCEDGVYLPNVFSPNGDTKNDIFYVRSNFILEMELNIYNRWGELLFTSTSVDDGWDGTYKGKSLPPDVYGYRLMYKCIDGEDYVKEGNVTLVK